MFGIWLQKLLWTSYLHAVRPRDCILFPCAHISRIAAGGTAVNCLAWHWTATELVFFDPVSDTAAREEVPPRISPCASAHVVRWWIWHQAEADKQKSLPLPQSGFACLLTLSASLVALWFSYFTADKTQLFVLVLLGRPRVQPAWRVLAAAVPF